VGLYTRIIYLDPLDFEGHKLFSNLTTHRGGIICWILLLLMSLDCLMHLLWIRSIFAWALFENID